MFGLDGKRKRKLVNKYN